MLYSFSVEGLEPGRVFSHVYLPIGAVLKSLLYLPIGAVTRKVPHLPIEVAKRNVLELAGRERANDFGTRLGGRDRRSVTF